MHRSFFRIAVYFSILISTSASAQHYIGMSFSEIAKSFKEEKGYKMANDGTLLTFTYTDSLSGTVQLKFRFDGYGKCFFEEYVASCDSCINHLLTRTLAAEKFGWKKINENQYVSKYKEFLMIELPVEQGDHSFAVFRTEWNKDSYKLLTGSEPE
jgi:hypothetical protein